MDGSKTRGVGCFGAGAGATFFTLLGLTALTYVRIHLLPAEEPKSTRRDTAREKATAEASESSSAAPESTNPWVYVDACAGHLKASRLEDARRECTSGLRVARAADANRELHFLLGQIAEGQGSRSVAEEHYLQGLAFGHNTRIETAIGRVGPRAVTKIQKWATVRLPATARNGTVRKLPWKTADEVAALDGGTRIYVEATVTTAAEGTWCAVRKQPTEPPLGWVHRGITDL